MFITISLNIIFLALGFFLLAKGADVFVDGSSSIAKRFKIPQIVIGLTVVAIGTSLPELVTSVVAAKKGDSGIAMGNVVGSSIFNILFILGTAGLISPMIANTEFFIDTAVLIAFSVIVFIFALTKRKTNRIEGAICLLLYVAYTSYIIMRAFHIWMF